jgi:hypothetical protein
VLGGGWRGSGGAVKGGGEGERGPGGKREWWPALRLGRDGTTCWRGYAWVLCPARCQNRPTPAPQAAFKLFGGRVRYWFTLNEPETFCVLGFDTGALPWEHIRG